MAKKLKIEKSKRKNKWNLFSDNDGIIDKSMLSGIHTEIFGNGKISIDGCMGVYEYRDTYLKLKLNKGAVIICGSDFDITQFENRLITIKGIISSVEFNI